jgi:P4 family phage/plasmid primase-like protien
LTLEDLPTDEERRAQAARFYNELYTRTPRLETAFIAIKRNMHVNHNPKDTKPAETLWLPLDCGPDAFADAVLASDAFDDVYMSVTPHREVSTTFGSQGTAATLCPTQVMQFDLDAGKEGTPASQDELLAVALDVFKRSDIPLHMACGSGDGMHAYVHLAAPLLLPNQKDLLARAAEWIRQEFAACGQEVDYQVTSDAARILRPAGSVHKKDHRNPKPVFIISTDPAAPITLEKLDSILPMVDCTRSGLKIPLEDDTRPGTLLSLGLDVRRVLTVLGWSPVASDDKKEEWTANLAAAASHINGQFYKADSDLPKIYVWSTTTAEHFGVTCKAGYTTFGLLAALLCKNDLSLATRLADRFLDSPEGLLPLFARFGTDDAPDHKELGDLARSASASWPTGLTKKHQAYLAVRGVAADVAVGRGYKSLIQGETSKRFKINASADALLVPIHPLSGKAAAELRLDKLVTTEADPKGKVLAATQSQRSATHSTRLLDIHPEQLAAVQDPSTDLIVVVAEAAFSRVALPARGHPTEAHYGSIHADAVLSAIRREDLSVAVCSPYSWSAAILQPGTEANATPHARLAGFWQGLSVKGRRIYLAGREHWQKAYDLITLAKLLADAGADVRVISIPRSDSTAAATSGHDTSVRSIGDYLALSSRQRSPLVKLLSGALSVAEADFRSHSLESDDASRYRHAAEGLARAGEYLYDATNKEWLTNKGTHFVKDKSSTPRTAVLELLERDYLDVSRAHFIKDALNAAAEDPRLARTLEQMETPKNLLNTPAGVLDLQTGVTRPRGLGEAYAQVTGGSALPGYSGITGSAFEKFMEETFCGDKDLIGYMQALTGMAMFGFNPEILALCLGSGRNGKSVYWGVIAALLGSYAGFAPASLLTGSGKEHQHADLYALRLLLASETNEGAPLDSAAVKDLTKTDVLRGAHKYGHGFDIVPTFLTVLMTNFKPIIRVSDPGTWERIKLIPFDNYVSEENRDRTLEARLRNEADLIFSWMAEGARQSAARGHVLPLASAVLTGTAEYRESQDLIGGFLDQEMVFDAGLSIKRSDLTESLNEWLKSEQGMTYRWTTNKISVELGQRKDALNIHLQKLNGEYQWVGMNLRAIAGNQAADRSNVRELRPTAAVAPAPAAPAQPVELAATGTDTPSAPTVQIDTEEEFVL